MERELNTAQHIIVFGLRIYRWVISPAKTIIFGPFGQCRFRPSCSAYALESVARHGALGGSWLAVKRVCRCHPWGGCGEDPVPATSPFFRLETRTVSGAEQGLLQTSDELRGKVRQGRYHEGC